jgi:PKHD-type hydroxylase
MPHVIREVLTASEAKHCREVLAAAPWADGRVTAGHQSARAKNNLQLPQDSAEARELGELVLNALDRNPVFISAALPAHIYPPLFNKYEGGMSFGDHVDNAIRPVPGLARRVRTDLSATLFLAAPEDYEGGELIVDGAPGVKLSAGDLFLYPATSVHRVAPVTRGARLAAFFWVQSLVRSAEDRALLFELDQAIVDLSRERPGDPALVKLTGVYHNLVRKWGDL